jgi:hypothetical protein
MPSAEVGTPRRVRWRLASAAPLPLLVTLFAVWTGLVTLDTTGFRLAWDPGNFGEWLALALGTVLLVAALWAPQRPLRVLGYAFYSLALAFGFGAAGVIAIVHAFGGPGGDQMAPTWALVTLGAASALCALALLALAALLVDDIRSADAEDA